MQTQLLGNPSVAPPLAAKFEHLPLAIAFAPRFGGKHWIDGANINRWLGAVVAVLPVALLFVFGGGIGQIASVGYVGTSAHR